LKFGQQWAKETIKSLNELRPLNICLKLEIGPTMGQGEKGQLWARDFFFFFFCVNKRLGFWNNTSKPKNRKERPEHFNGTTRPRLGQL
jgi:hypothetical protein